MNKDKLTLDKWDTLLIRACKSDGDILRRLRKIFRHRCLLPIDDYIDDGILYHLLDLIENIPELSIINVIRNADPLYVNTSINIDKFSYHSHFIQACIRVIRYLDPKLINYHPPAKFRDIKINIK